MDEILKSAGEIGLFQKIMIGFIGLTSSSLSAMCIYATIFTAADPKLSCKPINSTFYNYSDAEICQMWYNLTRQINMNEQIEYECSFDKTNYGDTMSTEWKFVCNEQFLISITQTSQMIGALCGLFSGYFGDQYGRRKSSIIFSLLLSTILVLSQILQSKILFDLSIFTRFILYTINQFFVGMLVNCSYCTTYVLLLELTTSKYHTIASNINSYIYVLGEFIVLFGYYYNRNWQFLNLIVTIYSVICCILMYFFLPESPEWLISVKRYDDAYKVLCCIAQINGRKETFMKVYNKNEMRIKFGKICLNKPHIDVINNDKQLYNAHELDVMLKTKIRKNDESEVKGTLMRLFYPKKTLFQTLLLIYVWNSLMLLYYGISLGITYINIIDPYLMFFLSSTVEIIGCIISYINDIIGRKKTFSIFLIMSAIMLLLVVIIPIDSQLSTSNRTITFLEILTVVFALSSKLLVSGAYGIIYIYTSELYTTNVRSTALLFLMCVGGISTFIAPQINLLRNLIWKQFPYIIYSVSALIGCVCLRYLPETKRKNVHMKYIA